MNTTMLSKFVRRKQSYEMFIPLGHRFLVVSSKSLHSFSMVHSIANKSMPNNFIMSKPGLKHVQCEPTMLGTPWFTQVNQYCQDNCNKHDHPFKDAIKKKRDQLIEREQRLRQTSQNILKDIRETKVKMKERMEDVIEVIYMSVLYFT